MAPSTYIILDALPLTANGKVDRKALPTSDPSAVGTVLTPPQTDTERTLAQLVQEVLQVPEVGLQSNFFDLGADSLQLVQLRNKLQASLGKQIPMVELFKHPTISFLAHYLQEAADASAGFDQEATQQIQERSARQKAYLERQKMARAMAPRVTGKGEETGE
jgi:acyl carrier protein